MLSTVLVGLIHLMRPKQWIKNGFVLAPLLFTVSFLDKPSVVSTLTAVIFFCIASSAAYILNDIHDITYDRQHPEKAKKRPLVTGQVNLLQAIILLLILYSLLAIAYFVQPHVIVVIAIYLVLNIAYTFALKHQPVIDIFCIALGFVLRVYAGAQALVVPVSSWMFVTTLCLALYLASIKRRQELTKSGREGRKVLKHYSLALVERYAEMSAVGALLFYSLFVMTTKPHMAVTIPIVIYGLFRYWFVVDCLDGGESPTDALFSDWQLMLTVIAWTAVCIWSLLA